MNARRMLTAAGCLVFALGTACTNESDPVPSRRPDSTPRATAPPRDAAPAPKTPTDQSESRSDIDITARIRSAIVDDPSLSLRARNCKIMTDRGIVTLRGEVDSDAERQSIGRIAASAPGVVRVDNQLEVKSP